MMSERRESSITLSMITSRANFSTFDFLDALGTCALEEFPFSANITGVSLGQALDYLLPSYHILHFVLSSERRNRSLLIRRSIFWALGIGIMLDLAQSL